jgi:hypothetical protein
LAALTLNCDLVIAIHKRFAPFRREDYQVAVDGGVSSVN